MRYEGKHVVLTESELHNLVNESVKIYLNEMDEGFWGGLKSVGQRAYNKATNQGGYQGTDTPQPTNGNFFNRMGQSIDRFGNSVTNAGKTWQMGSANQDAQKAIKNAISSLEALVDASNRVRKAGGAGLQGQAEQAVTNALQQLKTKGATGMASKFQQTANAASNGGKWNGWT